MPSSPDEHSTASSSLPPFGHLVRERRKALDLTQEDLAERIGCSSSLIRLIERGQRRPSRQIAGLLAEALKIPVGERKQFAALARGSTLLADDGIDSGEGERADVPSQSTQSVQLPPNNLPAQLTDLIGREGDLEMVERLLLRRDVRLASLTGPPGIGKTSLAIETATRLLNSPGAGEVFSDGVYWVPLASVTDSDGVIPTIARTLGVQDIGTQSGSDALKQLLKRKRIMLVLDNFEQIIQAAPIVADLLVNCPGLKVLVTSRQPLNVRGEHEYGVQALEVPSSEYRVSSPPDGLDTRYSLLGTVASVALFVKRAEAADWRFSLTEKNAPIVAAICARLDGLPLAIELVAARTNILSPAALLARLESGGGRSQLDIVSGGARDLPSRHRTLRDAIGWSYDLLSVDEQRLFRRLGVFSGGFSLTAVDAVCNARSDLSADVLEAVSQLVSKNLVKSGVTYDSEEDSEPHFYLLETIREYAVERLAESGEAGELRLLHCEYFLGLAGSLDMTSVGESERALYGQLDRNHDNLQSGLKWAIESGKVEIAAQFGVSLARYWELAGHYAEGRDWLMRIVAAHAPSAVTSRGAGEKQADLLRYAGRLNLYMCDYPAARIVLEQSVALADMLGLHTMADSARSHLGIAAWLQGDYGRAESLLEELLSISESIGNTQAIIGNSWLLGTMVGEQGDFVRAEKLLERSLALASETGDMYSTFGALRDLAVVFSYRGRYKEAVARLEESLAIGRRAYFQVGMSWALSALGFAVMGLGEYDRAERSFKESLVLARKTDKHRVSDTLEGLAEVGVARPVRAATLLGAADAVRRLFGMKVIPVRVGPLERLREEVRSRLADDEYERAYAAGQVMNLDDAIAEGLLTRADSDAAAI